MPYEYILDNTYKRFLTIFLYKIEILYFCYKMTSYSVVMGGGVYQKIKNTYTFDGKSENLKVTHWLNEYHTSVPTTYTSLSIYKNDRNKIIVKHPHGIMRMFNNDKTYSNKFDVIMINKPYFKSDKKVYFSDGQINKLIYTECDDIEFIEFINNFEIKSLYNCKHLLGKTFDVDYECVRGINEYYKCSIMYDKLINDNIELINFNYWNFDNETRLIHNQTIIDNYNEIREIEYNRLCILAKYDITANCSVLLSADFKDYCIKSENSELIENYMNKHNYDWYGGNDFGKFNKKYASSNNPNRFEKPGKYNS